MNAEVDNKSEPHAWEKEIERSPWRFRGSLDIFTMPSGCKVTIEYDGRNQTVTLETDGSAKRSQKP